ncbi:MAG: hypothetical protein AUG51_25315 [Acidobacteria bacterium 13_1_20CM_3_53_8]|nr:MAG: hypothetical protein AUG51_25315 [Acidobacteria bacterium 13_1_20CM_3_53_8]
MDNVNICRLLKQTPIIFLSFTPDSALAGFVRGYILAVCLRRLAVCLQNHMFLNLSGGRQEGLTSCQRLRLYNFHLRAV